MTEQFFSSDAHRHHMTSCTFCIGARLNLCFCLKSGTEGPCWLTQNPKVAITWSKTKTMHATPLPQQCSVRRRDVIDVAEHLIDRGATRLICEGDAGGVGWMCGSSAKQKSGQDLNGADEHSSSQATVNRPCRDTHMSRGSWRWCLRWRRQMVWTRTCDATRPLSLSSNDLHSWHTSVSADPFVSYTCSQQTCILKWPTVNDLQFSVCVPVGVSICVCTLNYRGRASLPDVASAALRFC